MAGTDTFRRSICNLQLNLYLRYSQLLGAWFADIFIYDPIDWVFL
jgi:hypothetical protein